MAYTKEKVTWDLVHMIHREYTPTALRLSPLQFRVLKAVEKGAKLVPDKGEYEYPALVFPGKDHIRVHRTTYRAIVRRKLVVREKGGPWELSLQAIAALEVYEL